MRRTSAITVAALAAASLVLFADAATAQGQSKAGAGAAAAQGQNKAAAGAAAQGQGQAQAQAERKSAGCMADYQQHCAQVQPGAGRLLKCILEHKAQISDGCKSSLRKDYQKLKAVLK